MSRIPEHDRGFRDGIRVAISWLHTRATEMNDPNAQAILNSAATNLGWDFKRYAMVSPPLVPAPLTGEEIR